MDKVQNGRKEHSGLCCGRARGKPWTMPAEEKSVPLPCSPRYRLRRSRCGSLWPVDQKRGRGEEDVVKALLQTAEAAKPHTRTQSCWRSGVPSFFGCFLYLNGRLTLIFMMAHFLCGVFPTTDWNFLSYCKMSYRHYLSALI